MSIPTHKLELIGRVVETVVLLPIVILIAENMGDKVHEGECDAGRICRTG